MHDQFYSRMTRQGTHNGEVYKRQSDMIMDATFRNDPAYRICYLQDKNTIFPEQTLSGYQKAKSVFAGDSVYDPSMLGGFKPVDCKYLTSKYYSISGDNVDYYLQFRPNAHGQNLNIRVGAYVFIPDDLGIYNLWLIVAKDDRPQFPQYYVLKCNLLLKWYIGYSEVSHFEGSRVDIGTYFSWSVQRTQSSYNSGVWSDYLTTTVENQLKAIVPTNLDTKTITYNEHFVISNNEKRRIAWETSKVEDTTTWGLTKLTFKQELEYAPEDNLSWINLTSSVYSNSQTGIDYDFYCARTNDTENNDPVTPEDTTTSVIVYTGYRPTLKIGGSFKTYTAQLYKSGAFVNNRPFWSIEYFVGVASVCTLNFIYDGSDLVIDNAGNSFLVDGTSIKYLHDGEEVFGIQYMYNTDYPMEICIKCLPIFNMIGNKFVLSVDDDADALTASASIEVEVESL